MMINKIISYIKDNKFKIIFVNNSLNIINYDKILEIENNEIKIIKENKVIKIIGNELKLIKLLDNEILIKGIINKIEL